MAMVGLGPNPGAIYCVTCYTDFLGLLSYLHSLLTDFYLPPWSVSTLFLWLSFLSFSADSFFAIGHIYLHGCFST